MRKNNNNDAHSTHDRAVICAIKSVTNNREHMYDEVATGAHAQRPCPLNIPHLLLIFTRRLTCEVRVVTANGMSDTKITTQPLTKFNNLSSNPPESPPSTSWDPRTPPTRALPQIDQINCARGGPGVPGGRGRRFRRI